MRKKAKVWSPRKSGNRRVSANITKEERTRLSFILGKNESSPFVLHGIGNKSVLFSAFFSFAWTINISFPLGRNKGFVVSPVWDQFLSKHVDTS
jgi:hypothetical protein